MDRQGNSYKATILRKSPVKTLYHFFPDHFVCVFSLRLPFVFSFFFFFFFFFFFRQSVTLMQHYSVISCTFFFFSYFLGNSSYSSRKEMFTDTLEKFS